MRFISFLKYHSAKMLKLPILTFLFLSFMSPPADAYSAHKLEQMSRKALGHLLRTNPKARAISEHSLAVLVFPEVIKVGFMAGVQRGDGVLFKHGAVAGYYNTTAASYGYQAGIQKFAYALFFMDHSSLKYLKKSDGFELGGAPTLVVANEGFTASASTTTIQKGICAFFFSQKGLMAGIGLQGTKITRFTPSE
jgi:lipid-binding SYLF domain-containing protein